MAADADAPEGQMSTGGGDADDTEGAEACATDADHSAAVEEDEDATPAGRRMSPVRLATLLGILAVVALGGVVGWLGFQTYQLRQEQQQRELFLRVGRQGAVNLTTIDWQNVNHDIQRILDSATGPFYDDFSKRSQPFIDVVKKVQSKSVGTVTEAGLESVSAHEARVLVAVSVKTSNLGAEDQPPRAWRMRIDVQKVDDGAKVSNVLFVPA
ncbi:Mce protein [Mycobacterium sp.]|uniref:Mce protein n=1 Tax=Mycobacterium sp. TaxID=1785 RepID=UPI002C9861F2|nr:Mce protein [Mycobacterium sp.]HTY33436.1 Mce protein [Mycobacterium sp.]